MEGVPHRYYNIGVSREGVNREGGRRHSHVSPPHSSYLIPLAVRYQFDPYLIFPATFHKEQLKLHLSDCKALNIVSKRR